MFIVVLAVLCNYLIDCVINDGNLCFDFLKVLSEYCKNGKPHT